MKAFDLKQRQARRLHRWMVPIDDFFWSGESFLIIVIWQVAINCDEADEVEHFNLEGLFLRPQCA